MKCSNCGAENKDTAKFCTSCGAKLVKASSKEEINTNQSAGKMPVKEESKEPVIVKTPSAKSDTQIKETECTKQTDEKTASGNTASQKLVKIRKGFGIFVIVFGLVTAIGGGWLCHMLAEEYKPLKAHTGYVLDGKPVIDHSFEIGGNEEAVEYYNNCMIAAIFLGIVFVASGALVYNSGVKFEKAPVSVKHGTIIVVDDFFISIEFDDGKRDSFQPRGDFVFLPGDTGQFDIKDKYIVDFKRD